MSLAVCGEVSDTELVTTRTGGSKKVQSAKDLSRIKIQKELNRSERKEGTGNQAHHGGPEERYGKWTAKRQAKLARRVCCLS